MNTVTSPRSGEVSADCLWAMLLGTSFCLWDVEEDPLLFQHAAQNLWLSSLFVAMSDVFTGTTWPDNSWVICEFVVLAVLVLQRGGRSLLNGNISSLLHINKWVYGLSGGLYIDLYNGHIIPSMRKRNIAQRRFRHHSTFSGVCSTACRGASEIRLEDGEGAVEGSAIYRQWFEWSFNTTWEH